MLIAREACYEVHEICISEHPENDPAFAVLVLLACGGILTCQPCQKFTGHVNLNQHFALV